MTGSTRTERDSLGPIEVPADRHWGAQTQRCLANFAIGTERMPAAFIHALGLVKQAAIRTNAALGEIAGPPAAAIEAAAAEVAAGRWDDEFPLPVWQTGSGTQTNMNANEVIASRANEILTGTHGGRDPVHPNDHVNRSQSSNDTIPTAMHVMAVARIETRLRPALHRLHASLDAKAREFRDIVKIGRTHLQDAVPMTLGQEFSGWSRAVAAGLERLDHVVPQLLQVAQGGTALGTGLNAPAGFRERFATELAALAGEPFVPADNPFEALAAHDALAAASGTLDTIALSLNKLANDLRLLSSGPQCGLGELRLPANEPGSSIMPGKVNPTQAEAMAMVCARVMGNHAAIQVACAQNLLQVQISKPLLIDAFHQSATLLADAAESLTTHCIEGIEPVHARLASNVDRSPMLVTALVPHIGYDTAARIARHALEEDLTLRDAAVDLGAVTAEEFDAWVDPNAMTGEA